MTGHNKVDPIADLHWLWANFGALYSKWTHFDSLIFGSKTQKRFENRMHFLLTWRKTTQ